MRAHLLAFVALAVTDCDAILDLHDHYGVEDASDTAASDVGLDAPDASVSGITVVQAKNNTSGAATTSITVPMSVLATGDINVVAVGWQGAGSDITTIADETNNIYQLISTTNPGGPLTQALYYAGPLTAVASNAVTVTFNNGPINVDLRVVECAGVAMLDAWNGNTGSGGTPSATLVTATMNAPELVLAAGYAMGNFVGANPPYMQDELTPLSNIIEHQVVDASAAYSATANFGGNNQQWIMQLATFR